MCYFVAAHRHKCICSAMPPGVSIETVLLYCLSLQNRSYFCRAWHGSSVTWLHYCGLNDCGFTHPILNMQQKYNLQLILQLVIPSVWSIYRFFSEQDLLTSSCFPFVAAPNSYCHTPVMTSFSGWSMSVEILRRQDNATCSHSATFFVIEKILVTYYNTITRLPLRCVCHFITAILKCV